MALEKRWISMEMFMKVNGLSISHKAKARRLMLMGQHMKVLGKKESSMAKER